MAREIALAGYTTIGFLHSLLFHVREFVARPSITPEETGDNLVIQFIRAHNLVKFLKNKIVNIFFSRITLA